MSGKHVAVLMGGWDSERQVSLWSGEACATALETKGYRVTRVDVDKAIYATLEALRPDVAFNALHGSWGEGGAVQGMLETLQIPYTHSGVLASALAMNKDKAKLVLAQVGIPTARGVVVDRFAAAKEHVLPPPYVVKPVAEGSSFGVIIVKADRTHPPQELLREDWPYGDRVLVESFVAGMELTCAVMGAPGEERALGIIEIVPNETLPFYDFDAKYRKGGSLHILPARLLPDIYQEVQMLAVGAHRALGCRGVSRADFRFDAEGTGELVCLEVNTQPGMTATSLVPDMAAYSGLSFEDLVAWLVEDASCNR
ncbi:D-alanine--D-alanine ligase [Siculibacillus lacustris]|uniref:D-alanine--D-alanine ligase n=1 Tax=Siculibacillus lacustris TaxID=1549641 RepID=A0A4Q9VS98_9HYPH|nr:D-alanine--D-alanine ligase [Siculibacillus lacustris]TBW38705.1 D-alanine--D-alanine ligase [Siculibacillus lacustris]